MKRDRRLQTEVLKNTTLVVLGTLILAFATGVFILPTRLVCGGVSGIAIVLSGLLFENYLSLDSVVFFITWGLFFLGLFVLGKSFALKTLISALIYPSAVSLFLKLSSPHVLGGFFCLSGYADRDLALILSALLGGALVGLGCALTFIGGGSTGGVDIIAFCVCRVLARMKPQWVIFFIDAATIALGALVIGDFDLSMLGILSSLVAVITIDKIFVLKKIIS